MIKILVFFIITIQVFIELLFSSVVWAQAIDPLRIAVQEPGKFSVNFNFDLIPSGVSFVAPDNSLGIRQGYGFALNLAINYRVNQEIGISGAIAGVFELGRVVYSLEDQISTDFSGFGNINLAYRLEPDGIYDPTLLVNLGYPWSAGIAISAQFIRDPLLLVGSFGIAKTLEVPGFWVIGGVSVSFIANERLTLSSQINSRIPFGGTSLPSLSLALRIAYLLNVDQLSEIGLRFTLSVRNDAVRFGFGADWTTQLP
jgi:hypothetical protein